MNFGTYKPSESFLQKNFYCVRCYTVYWKSWLLPILICWLKMVCPGCKRLVWYFGKHNQIFPEASGQLFMLDSKDDHFSLSVFQPATKSSVAYIFPLLFTLFTLFCWPCVILYQYSGTNVMHFLFSLLRIKGLYMFRALLTHSQEVLHNGTWYIVCVLCQLAAPGLILVQPTDIPHTQYRMSQ
jgi:hypothetical protein